MNTGLQKKQKTILKNIFLDWWIMQFFKKTMENVRKKWEFWYDYVKPTYGEKAKLCYMNTENFIVCIKTNDIYKHIAGDVETTTIHKIFGTNSSFHVK